MKVTMRSQISGDFHTREISVDNEKLMRWANRPQITRPLIQNYFPELNDSDREFLMTGITPEEWDSAIVDEAGSAE